MRTVAVFAKKLNEVSLGCLREMVEALEGRGCRVLCEGRLLEELAEKKVCLPEGTGRFGTGGLAGMGVDLLLSVGGDGTFLDSVEYVKGSDIPILGVNGGRLGFLANVRADEIRTAVDCIVEGRYEVAQREMLQLEVDGKRLLGLDYALNEVAVQKAATSSLLNVHASIGNTYLTTYWADGLVVATPTGSTAYSMSGGGPIVSPDCRNIILTPICPHNLSMRPLVVPSGAEIVLEVESRSRSFILSTDSRHREMPDTCRLAVKVDEVRLHVANLPGHNYYETLRNKLRWGEDRRNEI